MIYRAPAVVYPKDTVILHQVGRGPFAPSLVPFAIKVEMYMRICKIPYQNVHGLDKGPKDKWPWIEYNGEVVCDSAFIIKFLNTKFGVDLDRGFTEEELAIAHGFRKMMEENTYWAFVLNRWAFDENNTLYKILGIQSNAIRKSKKSIRGTTYSHGIGRHTEQQVNDIMRDDLKALSEFLGKKKFMLGDTICQADCAIFGQLAQYYWQCVGTAAETTVKEFQNLCDYCERIKGLYWPDWDECNTDGGKKTATKKEYPKDTVILHHLGRGPHAPSLTPFGVKLETYLRMAKVPYQNEDGMTMSSKGKVPFIIFNGEEIADTAFIIKFLNKKCGIDLNKDLSDEDKATAHAWRKTIEENTYWTLALERWVFDTKQTVLKSIGVNAVICYMIRRNVRKMAWSHGIGRHSIEEVYEIMEQDLRMLSTFLGKKKYLLGDRPCEEDCAIFGLLSQLYWHNFGNRSDSIIKGFPNLIEYCERMKENFWPDWDECNTHGGTREATK